MEIKIRVCDVCGADRDLTEYILETGYHHRAVAEDDNYPEFETVDLCKKCDTLEGALMRTLKENEQRNKFVYVIRTRFAQRVQEARNSLNKKQGA